MNSRNRLPRKNSEEAGLYFRGYSGETSISEMRLNNLFRMMPAFLLILALAVSCSGPTGKSGTVERKDAVEPRSGESVRLIKLDSPGENEELILNKGFKISLSPSDKNNIPDSVKIWFDGKILTTLEGGNYIYEVNPSSVKHTGRKTLKVTAFAKGGTSQTVTRQLIVYSDIQPLKKGYKIVNTYPHDKGAYTQGLVYEDGFMYEGTGQENESNLRKVELKTGKVVSQHNLDPQLFGEGIAFMGDRIYQLTWRSKVGFIYDKNSFSQLGKFFYQTEGWGLTTVGNRLVMSDGSNILYFIDPEMFTVESQIEVYDNRSKVDNLNELEYINGEIWANIYTTDLIACIDPVTGRVNSVVNLAGLLKNRETQRVDVLNGIAHDPSTGRIFVTGKYWPSLFEIRTF
jgi:glutamine cyclotransferase